MFLAVPDRGPFDGRTEPGFPTYLDRFHFLQITVDKGAAFPNIKAKLLDTRFLKNEQDQNFTGSAFAFSDTNPLDTVLPPPTAQNPSLKSIFKIDLNETGVTDVKNIVGIPASKAGLATAMPPIVPLTKTLVINLLNSNYVVDGTTTVRQVIAEKIEGLAWGPDLSNGHHVLYVISDNDLYSGYLDGKPLPTQIYAFEIDGDAAHIDYLPATLTPIFAPGQLKKNLTR